MPEDSNLTVQQWVYSQHSTRCLVYTNSQSVSSTAVKGFSTRRKAFLNQKCMRTSINIAGKFLLTVKEYLQHILKPTNQSTTKKNITHIPKNQKPTNTKPPLPKFTNSSKIWIFTQTFSYEVTCCLSNRQLDTVKSSDLHEDPLQLQWCSSWWHLRRQQHLQSREYPERPFGCQSFWRRSESSSFLQRVENGKILGRNKFSQQQV